MNCIIIDDESLARLVISKHCSKFPNLDVIEEFSNAIDAIKFLNKETVDIIFLDIHMPGFTGFDFLQTLRYDPYIVLTTSDKSFASDAYEYEIVIDYLVKPVTIDRFEKTIKKIEKAKSSLTTTVTSPVNNSDESEVGDELFINIDRRLIKIKYRDILFVEAKGDYIEVKTNTELYRVHSTLKKIKEKLPEQLFQQVHRSYIINFSKIVDIEDNSILIEKSVIPISRANRPEIMRRLNLL
ncbi:LytR/AlgR family response regulator transcription factor [Saccharicrinis aurantiacus]|uniref:LytR/AlgR family response regulator transcription factor n=1 Tax=Saccharicrinis aurantiacus TaxID=1849719 RepID=UPI0009500432|nr:LytTR family DNA-binding domain-containing protein [Saccharicrinis aurantiacus]